MSYKISTKASEDIEKIWLYTFDNWSQEQADRYTNLIFDEIEYLAANPDSGKEYSHVRKKLPLLKGKITFNFLQKNEIEIIRILHQQMDIANRLND